MQANPKIIKIFVVALIASLVLGACGGGTSGSTWFNLPSIPVKIGADGNASVFGFTIGPILQPAMLQQLQTANVQKLEVRLGYNGIHVYANGQDLPYIAWDASSLATLQDVVRKMPNVPNADLIANLLPWTRQIGLGVALALPLAPGAPVVDAPAWKGETTFTKENAPAAPTIGPLKLDSLAFDKQGNAKLGTVALSSLAPIKLDPNTLGLLTSLGLDKLTITTQPNGINLAMNDKPLPGIAYDSAILSRTLQIATPLLPDPNLANTLKDVLPKLPGAQLDVAVSFTGQPVGATSLAAIPVAINANGTLAVYGVPVSGNPIVPPDVMQKLQQAKIQNLSVDLGQNGLQLGANGQALPSLAWTPESLSILAKVAQQAGGVSPDLINNGLTMLKEMGGIKANISLGGAAPVTTTAVSTATATVTGTAKLTGTAAATPWATAPRRPAPGGGATSAMRTASSRAGPARLGSPPSGRGSGRPCSAPPRTTSTSPASSHGIRYATARSIWPSSRGRTGISPPAGGGCSGLPPPARTARPSCSGWSARQPTRAS